MQLDPHGPLAASILSIIKASNAGMVAKVAMLEAQVRTLEARPPIHVDVDAIAMKAAALVPAPKDGESGRDGKDAEPIDLEAVAVKAAALIPVPSNGRDGRDGTAGRDGKDAEPVDLDALALKAVELVPRPKDGEPGRDGTSVTVQDLMPVVLEAVKAIPPAKDGRDGDNGKDGADADMSVVLATVQAEVTKAVAALPAPKDGQDGASVTADDILPLVTTEVGKVVSALPAPKEPVSLTSTVVDRAGHLVLTFSDGTTKDVGEVVGKDAQIDLEHIRRAVSDELSAWPKPKDGEPGPPGRDATAGNLKVTRVDRRTWQLAFKDDTPIDGYIVIDSPAWKGLFKESDEYEHGDLVRWGGSVWIAKNPGSGIVPGTSGIAAQMWELYSERGRTGATGQKGAAGDQGPRGEKGERGPERW